MIQLAVIGAGQLGSRHLQSFALLDRPSRVVVVDPIPASLDTARVLFDQNSGDSQVESVEFQTRLEDIPTRIDVAVIATGADTRRTVVQSLLARCQVRSLILEKILFQTPSDYAEVETLLQETHTKAWVNCPRRIWPVYRKLKETWPSGPLDYRVTGSAWGLACNAIHFLDHAAFLSGQGKFSLESSELDADVFPSRRPGCVEFSGRIRGQTPQGTRVEIISDRDGDAPLVITIFSADCQLVVNETAGTAAVARRCNNWCWEPLTFAVPYQSQLTHLVVQQLLDEGDCELTPYQRSTPIHLSLLQVLMAHYRKHVDKDAQRCPIT